MYEIECDKNQNNSKFQSNEMSVELNWEMEESILNITELDSQVKQENMIPNIIFLYNKIIALNKIIYHMSVWRSIMVYELNEKLINDSVIKKSENVNHLNETVVIIIRGQMFVTLCMDMNGIIARIPIEI